MADASTDGDWMNRRELLIGTAALAAGGSLRMADAAEQGRSAGPARAALPKPRTLFKGAQ